MNAPITITGTVHAYNTNSEWLRNDELLARATEVVSGERDSATVLSCLHMTPSDMSKVEGWSIVGSAEVTVTFLPHDRMIAEALRGLQVQLDHARAEWLTKQQEILERISKLQALTNEVGVES